MNNHSSTLTGLPSSINATDITVAGGTVNINGSANINGLANINGNATLNHYGTMTSGSYMNKLETEIIHKLGVSDSGLKYSINKIESHETQVNSKASIEIEIICKMKHSAIVVINNVSSGALLNLIIALTFPDNIENLTKEELIADIKLEITLLKMEVLL